MWVQVDVDVMGRIRKTRVVGGWRSLRGTLGDEVGRLVGIGSKMIQLGPPALAASYLRRG